MLFEINMGIHDTDKQTGQGNRVIYLQDKRQQQRWPIRPSRPERPW